MTDKELLQNILRKQADYDAQLDDLFRTLESYSFEQLNRKPADGGWSAVQTMQHLMMSEELAWQYVQKKVQYGADAPPVNWTARFRLWLLIGGLFLPIKIKAPKVVIPEVLAEGVSLSEVRARWEAVRSQWRKFLQEMPEAYAGRMLFKHVVAGRLSFEQMFDFYKAHFRRHYGQIMRALNTV